MPNYGNPISLASQCFIRASCFAERSARMALSSNTSLLALSCCIMFYGFWSAPIWFSLRFLGFGPAKRAALRPLPTTEILIHLKTWLTSDLGDFFECICYLVDGGDVWVRGRQQLFLSTIHCLLSKFSELIFSEWGTDLILNEQNFFK